MSIEREAKLQASVGFRMPDLHSEGVVASAVEDRRLVATYFDTDDRRLLRWGVSLRHRSGEGWTVKLPMEDQQTNVLARAEHVEPGKDPRRMPSGVRDLVTAFARAGSLVQVARLQTRRRETRIADDLGRPIASVTDDEVSIMQGRRVASRFRELEVEIADGVDAAAVDGVIERLRAAGSGPVENVSKLRRAIGPLGHLAPEIEVADLDGDATVMDVVRRAIATSVVRLIVHDPRVRLGLEPEAVHQARVATRHLRSDLRTFRDLVDPAWSGPLRDELRWLGAALGEVRDIEVLRDRLRGREELLGSNDARMVERLVGVLEERREAARERLLIEMRQERYVALLDALVAAAASPAVIEDVAALPGKQVLGVTMTRPWKHLRNAIGHAEQDGTDEALHEARIRTKRVRYAAEAVASVFGKTARRFASAAADLQDVLGEHQDAVVADAFLREAATSSVARAFVAGELAMYEAQVKASARDAWPAMWEEALDRKRLRFWT